MLIEVHTSMRSTTWKSVRNAFSEIDQSNLSPAPLRLLKYGRESLAVSLHAASMQRCALELANRLYFLRAFESTMPASLRESLFPALVDATIFRSKTGEQSFSREKDQLADRLRTAFQIRPLEDGMHHPAEKIIEEALQGREDFPVLDWFKGFSLDAAHPSFAASILRCLGRQPHIGNALWRTGLVREGLAMGDVEIRDAAAQAAESWGSPEMRTVLEAHSEPLPWLQDYIWDIIDDLRA